MMNMYAFICTRSKELSHTTEKLVSYLSRANIHVKLLVNQSSIFEGYKKAFTLVKPKPSDIIILCHDDIEIQMAPALFIAILSTLQNKKFGFLGPAGTTKLSDSGVWWDHNLWKEGFHRGEVVHLTGEGKSDFTRYGPFEQVAVLDGVFLAARAEVLEEIGLEKPTMFTGEWDFYDIYYTDCAAKLGYENHAAPIKMIHNSRGELVGRDSWHKNREAFIKENKERFPITC